MKNNRVWGIVLVLLGILLFFRDYVSISERIKLLWPVILIIIGIFLLFQGNRDTTR